jgi:hypothetical protein
VNKTILKILIVFILLLVSYTQACGQQVIFSASGQLLLNDVLISGMEQATQAIESPIITFYKPQRGNVNWHVTVKGTDFTGNNTGYVLSGSLLKYTKTGRNITGEFTQLSGVSGIQNLEEPQYTNKSVNDEFIILSGRFQNPATGHFQYIPLASNFRLIIPGDVMADTYTSTITITFTQF